MIAVKYSHVFWDWNGTLLNDVGTALRCVNDMLAARSMPPIGLELYHEHIGTPIRGFYEKFFDLSLEDYDRLLAEYHKLYAQYLWQTDLAQGAVDVLKRVKDSGVKQTLLSSSEHKQLEKQTKHFEVYDLFDHVLGAKDFQAAGKTQRAQNHIRAQNISASGLLVVGDIVEDCQMAKSVGADCMLLAAGHQSRARLETAGVRVIGLLDEIFD